MEKILASPGFATSERHSKLLRHLVSMSLAGRGAEIKEYALGVELFGRGDSFDPATDAIVRTEASRLRASHELDDHAGERLAAVRVHHRAANLAGRLRLNRRQGQRETPEKHQPERSQ